MESISELEYNLLNWKEMKGHYLKQLESEFAKTQKTTITYKDEIVMGGMTYENPILKYTINAIELEAKIKALNDLIKDGTIRLEKIKNALQGLKHPKYKAYYMRKELYMPMWKIANELDRSEGTIRKWLRDMKEGL